MNYNKLKEAVKRSKLQRKEIAERSNVTPKTIDNLLAGADPKVSTLEAVAKVVGIKIGLLFDEEIEIRQAGRDYTENDRSKHFGTEYSGTISSTEADLRDQIAILKSQLQDKERIIKLMEDKN